MNFEDRLWAALPRERDWDKEAREERKKLDNTIAKLESRIRGSKDRTQKRHSRKLLEELKERKRKLWLN